jgi:hypothetical protein
MWKQLCTWYEYHLYWIDWHSCLFFIIDFLVDSFEKYESTHRTYAWLYSNSSLIGCMFYLKIILCESVACFDYEWNQCVHRVEKLTARKFAYDSLNHAVIHWTVTSSFTASGTSIGSWTNDINRAKHTHGIFVTGKANHNVFMEIIYWYERLINWQLNNVTHEKWVKFN